MQSVRSFGGYLEDNSDLWLLSRVELTLATYTTFLAIVTAAIDVRVTLTNSRTLKAGDCGYHPSPWHF